MLICRSFCPVVYYSLLVKSHLWFGLEIFLTVNYVTIQFVLILIYFFDIYLSVLILLLYVYYNVFYLKDADVQYHQSRFPC